MSRRCNFFCFCYVLSSLLSLGVFIFWLIFLPQELKFTVSDASLTQFDYIAAPNNTLFYSLTLNVTVRNPNKKVGVYFHRVQVISNYRKKRFSLVTLESTVPFYLGRKNMTVFEVAIRGQQILVLKEKDVKQYDSEKGLGFYSIDLKLVLRVRIRYGKVKTETYKSSKIRCKLKIPLSNPNRASSNGNGFRATSCDNVSIIISPDD